MHPSAQTYVAHAAKKHSRPGLNVVEFGSYDVNGSPRQFFPATNYVGIDIRPGRGVDHVQDAATFKGRGFDIVVSTEALEHMSRPKAVIQAARKALNPGGVLIATMASPERHPHNNDGDHDAFAPGEHYAGIDPGDLEEWLTGWEILDFQHHSGLGDVYVTARAR